MRTTWLRESLLEAGGVYLLTLSCLTFIHITSSISMSRFKQHDQLDFPGCMPYKLCALLKKEQFLTEYPWLRPLRFKNQATLHGREVPVLKMLKRQIRNFREGKRATVTLVFRSTYPVLVRWFRLAPKLNMGRAEISNMLPVEGDPDYKISFITSGEVTATTLSTMKFREVFPRDYETVLTTLDGTMQYQLRTVIKEVVDYELETIDSPEWISIPPPKMHFKNNHALKVHCKIFVPSENPGFTNELNMVRVITKLNLREDMFEMDFQRVVSIHKMTQNYAEEDGPAITQGMREQHKHGHVSYEVRLRNANSTWKYEGVYLCGLEREFDKVYVSSLITLVSNQSPFPDYPMVELKSCERTNYDALNNIVVFLQGQETCLRCRGIGHPRPKVALYDETDREITASSDISVTKYINVADGGVSEATYTFRRPSHANSGRYVCKAYNDRGSRTISFRILL